MGTQAKMNARFIIGSACGVSLLVGAAAAAPPPFTTPAPVAYMQDLSSGAVLYAKDADRRIPPASMAKMMTTLVAFDLIKKGELKPDQKFTVQPATWQRWHGPAAGSTMFLSPNEQVSVRDLLHGIVTLSGNDASVVVAEGIAGTEEAFAALMNERAQALGMTNSRFGNSNGWPDEGRTVTTARDLARLAAATIQDHPQLYREYYGQPSFTWGRTLGGNAPITQGNRNPLLGKVAGADGLKTGHTAEAGYGFTGSAEQAGRRLVMVVAGLDSYNGRIDESVRFMNWGFGSWRTQPLFDAGERVGAAEVQLGAEDSVSLVAPRRVAATTPTTGLLKPKMKVSVRYNGPLKAPIAKGQHVADLVVATPDMPVQVTPLVAGEAVGEAGFLDRLWAGIGGLFA